MNFRRVEIVIAANERIVDAARPILTGVQVAALETLYRRQRLQMKSQNELNRLRLEATLADASVVTPN